MKLNCSNTSAFIYRDLPAQQWSKSESFSRGECNKVPPVRSLLAYSWIEEENARKMPFDDNDAGEWTGVTSLPGFSKFVLQDQADSKSREQRIAVLDAKPEPSSAASPIVASTDQHLDELEFARLQDLHPAVDHETAEKIKAVREGQRCRNLRGPIPVEPVPIALVIVDLLGVASKAGMFMIR